MAVKNFILAKPVDLSGGFSDFFATIGLTGAGLVSKGVAAVLAVIAVKIMISAAKDPQAGLRKGSIAVGTLFFALTLALFGDDIFATVNTKG